MKTFTQAALGSVLLGVAGSASASNFFLCPPSAGGGCTDAFEQATTFLDATSNYADNDASGTITPGDTVLDVATGNITGFQPFSFGTETQNYSVDWIINASIDDLLQGVAVVDDSPLIDGANNGDGQGQIGETVGVVSQIVSGTVQLFYQDGGAYTTEELVAELVVDPGGVVTAGDFVITADVVFDNVTDTTLAQNLFFFDKPGGPVSWFDLWSQAEPVEINARFDTNIDQLEVLTGTGPAPFDDFTRETDLDGSLRFEAPEPGSLALVGLGVLGAGLAGRRRAKA